MKKLTLPQMTERDESDNTNIILNDQEPSVPSDEISLMAIGELLNLEKLKTISRLKPNQVANLTKLYLFAETFGVPFTKALADNILQLQISHEGLGRRELVQLVQQRSNGLMFEPQPTKKGLFR
jgi:hypothetical protein